MFGGVPPKVAEYLEASAIMLPHVRQHPIERHSVGGDSRGCVVLDPLPLADRRRPPAKCVICFSRLLLHESYQAIRITLSKCTHRMSVFDFLVNPISWTIAFGWRFGRTQHSEVVVVDDFDDVLCKSLCAVCWKDLRAAK